ncbi:MAG TPA: hypothetical protein VHV75_16655 [Solirubrobacteraceae bacterium]|nr:hypothetical protein [Solirubrobacteraceae bacterium]
MWRRTIARSGRPARLAARLVTGPGSFLLAGMIDVLAGLWWLAGRRLRGRSF